MNTDYSLFDRAKGFVCRTLHIVPAAEVGCANLLAHIGLEESYNSQVQRLRDLYGVKI
ncbi:MAG: hypothetical protein PHU12_00070 [Candidatus Aenigmarchaeota archaeon]|nr:hypothetical protein [Candidatus Aenigmarchaeota archaeon]